MSFTTKTYNEIVTEITKYILEHQSEITDLNVGSVIRTLIEAYALELSSEEYNGLYQQLLEVYNSTRISTATGNDLDELASLVGVSRKDGVKASNYLTFGRNSVATSDFDIPSGTIVSTQPIPGETSLRYIVKSTVSFKSAITEEEHTFNDGIFYYKLNQRLIDSITKITATVGGSSTILVEGTDFSLVNNFNGKIINSLTVVDSCDDVTNWSSSSDATAVEIDNSDYKEGTGSFKIGKSGTSTSSVYYEKSYISSNDISNKKLFLWLYFNTTISSSINDIEIWLGNDSSNYLKWIVDISNLSDGWNRLFLNPEDSSYVGYPKIDEIDYFRIVVNTDTSSTTFTNDNIKLDLISFVETEEYEGDVILFINKPDDGTNFYVDYKPLSVEVLVEAEEVGTQYNVAKHKINYMISSLADIDFVDNYVSFTNGEDEEDDENLRSRIKNANYVLGKATTKAIESNLQTLSYVKSVNVDDMPLKTQLNEEHTFTTGTTEYQLQYEVAQSDDTLEVVAGETTLSSDITDSDTTITVADTSEFPDSGYIKINNEIIQYTSKTSTTFDGCTRGAEDTIASSHTSGDTVVGWFKPTVDYNLTNESKISWIGNTPPDGVVFKVTYDYRWLGHIDIYVVGNTALTSEQLDEIDDLIQNEYKAAGIQYELKTPSYASISITVSVNINPGYTFDEVKQDVINILREKLNSYDIGEDVYLSQLYDVIHNVEGVKYAVISTPSNDVTIDDNEIARAGTIVVNQI